MTKQWVGHTSFSSNASVLGGDQIDFALANGHTLYSLGLEAAPGTHVAEKRDPGFVAAFSGKIKAMDDRHADLYMFGDHSVEFNVDRQGTDTSNWVCPWQPSSTSSVAGFLTFAGLNEQDVVVDFGCGDGRVVSFSLLSKMLWPSSRVHFVHFICLHLLESM
jgi:hypothetical protein